MSGLAVVLNTGKKQVSESLLRGIASRADYRGPDGKEIFVKDNLGFAYLALNSTPEMLHDKQPLISNNGQLILVADARIDNRRELISTLDLSRSRQAIVTDSELILAAYRRWGVLCSEKLIGDFAFVLWDGSKRRLLAARDALGVRSLYYAMFGQELCIASEAQQLLSHPGASWEINDNILAGWCINQFDDTASIFKGICRLPAGHTLLWSDGRLGTKRYWDIDPFKRIRYKKKDEYAEQLRELLTRSVSDRLRTDSKIIGSFMSGGMDSTSVTALAHQALKGKNRRLAVFSWRFQTLKDCDESGYIDAITRKLGLYTLNIDAEQYGLLCDSETYPPSLDDPGHGFDSLFDVSYRRLEEMGGNVMLTGIGGDQMTWGSHNAYAYRFWNGHVDLLPSLILRAKAEGVSARQVLLHTLLIPMVPDFVRKFLHNLRNKQESPYWSQWIAKPLASQLLKKQQKKRGSKRKFRNRALQEIYENVTNSFTGFDVQRHERLAAYRGIDVRHPFVDRRIAEFVVAVPSHIWNQSFIPKYLLRCALKGLLPESVLWRKDKPDFWSYWAKGLRQKRTYVESLLKSKKNGIKNVLNVDGLVEAYQEYLSQNPEHACPYIHSPIMTVLWWDFYKQKIRKLMP